MNSSITPDQLKTMTSDDILTQIVFLYKGETGWNEDKEFKYLVLRDALRDAFLRERKEP